MWLHWSKAHYSKETFVQGTVVQGDSLSKEKRATLVQGDTSIDFSPRKLYLAHNYVCWVPLSPLVRPRRQVRVRATHELCASSVLVCDH